ncbi:MAG TPA: hypothetical protein DEB17_02735 [Chlorobaculum sp.]|uniref:Uncharacterized protein n=1 Tax=Chlorobaculum tepidum (strain ATCC 49652 / DSM 12025 / NBRC 103806 / TLS) TaxID=194439 RepID=Q8KED8_CHLTE|nr:hypothetical protein CT0751 [Chlorobaculum tepidum TLS]HBU22908.1 hypothetical protein [Chlorobaculum sp.]
MKAKNTMPFENAFSYTPNKWSIVFNGTFIIHTRSIGISGITKTQKSRASDIPNCPFPQNTDYVKGQSNLLPAARTISKNIYSCIGTCLFKPVKGLQYIKNRQPQGGVTINLAARKGTADRKKLTLRDFCLMCSNNQEFVHA